MSQVPSGDQLFAASGASEDLFGNDGVLDFTVALRALAGCKIGVRETVDERGSWEKHRVGGF